MTSLDRALQPRDLSNYSDKSTSPVTVAPLQPIVPVRRVPISPNANANANRLIANSQNQAEYAVKKLLTKPRSLAPSDTLSSGSSKPGSTVVVGGFNPWSAVVPSAPPPTGTFTWVNQGSATAIDAYGGIFVSCPSQATDNLHLLVKTPPPIPWSITIFPLLGFFQNNNFGGGLCLTNGTQVITFRFGGSPNVGVDYYNTVTSFNSTPTGTFSLGNALQFLKITNTGTQLQYAISVNGSDFSTVLLTTAVNAFLPSITGVGLFVNANNSSTAPHTMLVNYWTGIS